MALTARAFTIRLDTAWRTPTQAQSCARLDFWVAALTASRRHQPIQQQQQRQRLQEWSLHGLKMNVNLGPRARAGTTQQVFAYGLQPLMLTKRVRATERIQMMTRRAQTRIIQSTPPLPPPAHRRPPAPAQVPAPRPMMECAMSAIASTTLEARPQHAFTKC